MSKKKSNKRYTILVVPQDSGKVKSFKLPKLVAKVLLFLSIISSIVVSGIIYDYVRLRGEIAGVYKLKDENRSQRLKIQSLAGKLTELEKQMARLETFDRKLRIIAGLKVPEKSDQILGVGGPLPGDDLSLITDEERDRVSFNELDNQVNLLKKEAEKQEKSFAELHNYLLGKKTLLASTPSIWPTKGWLTSTFGYRVSPYTGLRELHKGIDIANRVGTPIIATADGVVVKTGRDRALGNYIIISHGYGMKTEYGHLSKILVKRGKKVKRGQKIALMGNTGRSTGPHLHYTIIVNGMPVNPRKYILN